jgi:extracellular factor (EF) 3-hydroxypalmitic acid methyl ester biosynthesis protein
MSSSPAITGRVRELADELLRELQAVEPLAADPAAGDEPYRLLSSAIDRCLAQLSELNIWGKENKLLSSPLWNVAGHLLSRGWLLDRAYRKPRGYAGDYELLSRIYRNELSADPLGRLIDRYFQEQHAPRAVRHRMAMMADWIVEEATARHHSPLTTHHSLHVATLGSAFGLEVRDALLRLDPSTRQSIHVTLLDVDPAAAEAANRELSPLLPPERLTATSTNLFRLPERPRTAQPLHGADLLFCPGLFDYLDDPAAAAMVRCLYQQLAPGGRLTVFQFAPSDPTRAYMQWFANWYLIYRDQRQLYQIVAAAGLTGAIATYGAEPLGVDLYVTVTKA